MPSFGGAPSCPRCGKAVYMAEQIAGPGGMWHKTCLTCKECNKRLDSTTLTEKNSEAYCKTCYGKLFGPKGYGYGGGTSFLNTDSTITQRFSPPASREGSQSNLAKPSTTTSSSQPTSPHTSNPNLSKSTSQSMSSIAPGGTAIPKPKFGGADPCPKCGKAVYFAEQILGPGNVKYHKLCFRCTDCNKSLDSSNMADKDGVIYCKTCHGKKWGPKGYGYGGGAGVLTTE
ncbi:hypothetical protein HK097_010378 [Rhizophlyctis rosea]|uniref:LIM zinc-binding domain-containing protein n=1 Tax=Rhizophlyctis rosea TaxID=64517 RepID=A0AAD5X372_9FUNG|nr:hypothetical protein HK097_010378 [Rhizophlyctis rosea]